MRYAVSSILDPAAEITGHLITDEHDVVIRFESLSGAEPLPEGWGLFDDAIDAKLTLDMVRGSMSLTGFDPVSTT